MVAKELEPVHLDGDVAHADITASAARQRLDVLPHLVDAEDRRAALVGQHADGNRGRQRPRQRLRVAEDPPQEPLSRGAHDHRTAERGDLAEAGEELEVVLHRLAEADPGVDADLPLVDPGRDGDLDPLLQERGHLARRRRRSAGRPASCAARPACA